MNVSYLIAIFAVGIIGLFFYAQSSLKNKIRCTFRRANKTIIEKRIPIKSRYVIFDNGKYNVNPKRISLFWMNKGIYQFFPQFIPSLDFRFDSPEALDPETFQNTWDTPEARQASQQEGSFIAFAKGVQSQVGKKSRFPEWLFPVITIGLIAVLGFLIYKMSGQIAWIQQVIQSGQQVVP